MKRLNVINCMIISPQDVQAEREAISAALERWNGQIGNTLDTIIHAVRWETHSTPELGAPPQTLLNKQIVKDCDCAVAVFWSRLGTPTEKADSGSMEEIHEILEKGGHVLVYVCKRDIPQVILDPEQLKRLNEVLDGLRKKGIVFEYKSLEELQMLLMGHLTTTANKILSESNTAQDERHGDTGQRAKTISSLPDVRVTTSWGLPTDMGSEPRSVLCSAVQNHSGQPLYFSTIYIELSDGRSLAPMADAFGRPIQGPIKLDPGASLNFYFDFAEVLNRAKDAEGARLRRFVVTDQIDRRFYSSEKGMEIALSNYQKWTGS